MRNVPEERRYHSHRGESLKSRKIHSIMNENKNFSVILNLAYSKTLF